MKGNIIVELRKVVKTLYAEGHKEVFAISIIDNGGRMTMQVVDFDLNVDDLDIGYKGTYCQGEKVLQLVKARYGANCKAVNALFSNGTHGEELSYDRGVLKVYHLNV